MKRCLILFPLLLCCLVLKGQTYEESMRYWSDGPLVWDDLKLKVPKDFATCDLNFRWLTTTKKERPVWNTVVHRTVSAVALDKSISWHNAERMYPCALAYDQVLFDLNELYFRKMLTELYSKDNQRSGDALYAFYRDQSSHRWKEIEEDTNDGLDSTMVAYYARQIADELAETSYPDMTVGETKDHMGLNLGYGNSLFFGDAAQTFSPTHGVLMDFFLGFGKHETGLVFSVGGGTLLRDFNNDGYIWTQGRSFNHTNVGFSYGYRVYDGTFFSVKPFVGIGARMLIPVKEKNQNPEIKEKNFGSFVALGGAEVHFKLFRSISRAGGYNNGLGLRIYAARDFGLLQATSLNFGIFYNTEMFFFR